MDNRRISGPVDDVIKSLVIADNGVKSFKEDASIIVTGDTDLPTQYMKVKTVVDNYIVVIR